MNKRIAKKKGLSKIDNRELWDLDLNIASYILPRLIAFKKQATSSYPSKLSGVEEWINIIDKMIYSFERKLKRVNMDELEKEKYKEGLYLFSEYFDSLWI